MVALRMLRTSLQILIGLSVLIFGSSTSMIVWAVAEPANEQSGQKRLVALELTADELVQAVEQGDLEQALLKLRLINKQMKDIPIQQYTSMEGIKALAETMIEANQKLVAIQPDQQACKLAVAKVRLAIDALQDKAEYMWRQYDKLLYADLNKLEGVLQNRDPAERMGYYNQMLAHFEIIRPSIVISLDPSQVEMFRHLLQSFGEVLERSSSKPEERLTLLKQVRESLQAMFAAEDDKTTFMPIPDTGRPLYWTTIIGSFIAVVLAFAAWRIIQADRGYVSVSERYQEPFMKD